MITKERLEELIEQGATIYYVDKADNMRGKIDLSEYEVKIVDNYFLIKTKIKPDFSNYFGYEPDWHYGFHIYLIYTFETEEDARWELEMTATRTETLKLPTWKEFKKGSQIIHFHCYPCDYECSTDLVNIYIREFFGFGGKDLYTKPLTKENYIEACKLCLKLFNGEEV